MPEVIHSASFKSMPWQNGGGTTREIYRFPDSENFKLRVSVASVQKSGSFSKFPGIDRFLMLLEGNGFVLNKNIKLQRTMDHYEFPGEEDIFCELINGACTDFNVMVDRNWGRFEVKVSRLHKSETWDGHADYLYLHKAQSEFLLLKPDESVTILASEDMLVVEIFIQKVDSELRTEAT